MPAKKNEQLNIAHFHWGFPPMIGGVETHLTIILPEMVSFGHSVSLLTGKVPGTDDHVEYKGVHITRTPIMDLNWLKERGLIGLEEEIHQVFSDFLDHCKPDIIHVHNMHYFSEIHAKILAKLAEERGCPLFLTAHNVWDDLLYLDLTHNIAWTHIIAVSHFIKKEMIGVGVNDDAITVIHHGVNQEQFKPMLPPASILTKYPRLKKRPVVFHPARVSLVKGCDISVKAIRIVKRKYPDVLFVFAGARNIIDWEGTQQGDIAYLVNIIKYFDLEDNVMIDIYPLEEMQDIYAASDVVIYPSSVGEPFGLVMLEAMAMAKPIIVTNVGGMPEVVHEGINGFVIPARDFETLGYRIIQILDDDGLKRRLGNTGRQILESQYTKRKVAWQTISLYEKFLKK